MMQASHLKFQYQQWPKVKPSNSIEPNTTEESVRPAEDYYFQDWETQQLATYTATPKLLSEALAEATYEEDDLFTERLSNLLCRPEDSDLVDEVQMIIELMIQRHLKNTDAYNKHLRYLGEVEAEQRGESIYRRKHG